MRFIYRVLISILISKAPPVLSNYLLLRANPTPGMCKTTRKNKKSTFLKCNAGEESNKCIQYEYIEFMFTCFCPSDNMQSPHG